MGYAEPAPPLRPDALSSWATGACCGTTRCQRGSGAASGGSEVSTLPRRCPT